MRFGIRDWLMAIALLSLHANLILLAYQDIEAAFGTAHIGFAILLPIWVLTRLCIVLRQRKAGKALCSFHFQRWRRGAWIATAIIDADLLFASVTGVTPLPLGIWRHVLLALALIWSFQSYTLSVCQFGIVFHHSYWPWEKLHTILQRYRGVDYLVLDPTFSKLSLRTWLPLKDPSHVSRLQQLRAAAILTSPKTTTDHTEGHG